MYIVDPVCGINNNKNHQTASQHIGNATPFQERAGHPCGKLSGGQKRRLWVATALKRGVKKKETPQEMFKKIEGLTDQFLDDINLFVQ